MEITDIQKVDTKDLQPGDVIVIRTPMSVSQASADRLIEYAAGAFKEQKIIVLCEGLSIEVYRQTAKPE